MGISKFMAPDPLVHYTFLYRINTSGVKNRLLVKIVENVKSWYCENILRKQKQLLTIFAKCSIVHVWQGSEYASVSNFEYSRVLNMPGVRQGSEYARIIFEHAWIFLNMPKYAWMFRNLPEWQMFYFPHCSPLSTWTLGYLFQSLYKARSCSLKEYKAVFLKLKN